MQTYRRQFHSFLCFAIKNNVQTVLSVKSVIGFLEFLVGCNLSPRAVANYASGIKSYAALYQLPIECMDNPMIGNYLKALQIQVPHVKKQKLTLSLQDMYNISVLCQQFDHPVVYRVAFLLSFYGFLHTSNQICVGMISVLIMSQYV